MKDKFLKQIKWIVCLDESDTFCAINDNSINVAAEKCEQIADEYAIGFAEFIMNSNPNYRIRYVGNVNGKQYYIDQTKEYYTTKQLLELYKQSLKTTI